MADIIQIAEKLNAEASRLNMERSKLEGKTESAKAQYEKAVKAYESKYGVKLTPENLQSVYNDVYARKLGLAEELQAKITSINNGDYKKNVEEHADFDLTPDVSPVRVEVKEEKKKRRTKESVKKEENLDDLLASADSVLTGDSAPMVTKPVEDTTEIKKAEQDPVEPPVIEKKGVNL